MISSRYSSNAYRNKNINKSYYCNYYEKNYIKKNYLYKIRSSFYIFSIRRFAIIDNIKLLDDIDNYNQFLFNTFDLKN